MVDGFLMHLVVKLELLRQLADLFELLAYSFDLGDVVVVVAPERDSVVLLSDAEDGSVDDLEVVELAGHHVQHQSLPGLVALLLHVLLDGQSHHPLAALLVVGVLPLWADALLEQQVVRVRDDLADRVDVVVHPPEVLNLS